MFQEVSRKPMSGGVTVQCRCVLTVGWRGGGVLSHSPHTFSPGCSGVMRAHVTIVTQGGVKLGQVGICE